MPGEDRLKYTQSLSPKVVWLLSAHISAHISARMASLSPRTKHPKIETRDSGTAHAGQQATRHTQTRADRGAGLGVLHACTWLVLASARFPSAFSSTMATSRSCPTTTSTAKTYRRQSPKQKMHRIPSRRPRKRASRSSAPCLQGGVPI